MYNVNRASPGMGIDPNMASFKEFIDKVDTKKHAKAFDDADRKFILDIIKNVRTPTSGDVERLDNLLTKVDPNTTNQKNVIKSIGKAILNLLTNRTSKKEFTDGIESYRGSEAVRDLNEVGVAVNNFLIGVGDINSKQQLERNLKSHHITLMTHEDNTTKKCTLVFNTNGTQLGQGGMGTVRQAITYTAGGTAASEAVKLPKEEKDSKATKKNIEDIQAEIKTNSLIKQNALKKIGESFEETLDKYFILGKEVNVIKTEKGLFGRTKETKVTTGLLMPKAESDLSKQLRTKQVGNKQLPISSPSDRVKYIKNITGAVACLHEIGLVHRDLKLNNVLIHKGEAKLADFGLSEKQGTKKLVSGTRSYMAPEDLKEMGTNKEVNVNEAGDCWSLGVMLCELIQGKALRVDINSQTKASDIKAFLAVLSSKKPTNEMYHVVMGLLDPDPITRMTSNEANAILSKIPAKTMEQLIINFATK